MLTSAVAVLAGVALLLPGFIAAELARAGRARALSESDLALALRALGYALVLHLAFAWWTASLVDRVGPGTNWTDHVGAIVIYAAVVLVLVPAALGLALNRYLTRAESQGRRLAPITAALGGRDARDAFDYAFQRPEREGAWVIVELVGHARERPRLVGGLLGERSAAGQGPEPHDLYLEEMWAVAEARDDARSLSGRIKPLRSVYIAADQVARIELVSPPFREISS